MKNLIYYLIFLVLAIVSCDEKELKPLHQSDEAPGVVTVKSVKDMAGAARINYSLPNSNDLLYVVANYKVDDKSYNVKSSVYKNYVELYGFNDVKSYDVELVVVNRSEAMGAPVKVTVNPSKAPVHSIFETLNINTDWGGAVYNWTNDVLAPVVINLMAEDSTGTLQNIEWVYTEAPEFKFSIRGFDTVETKFAAFVRDRYDNYSDTVFQTIKPLFEQEIEVGGNNRIVLADDSPKESWGNGWPQLFDGKINSYVALKGGFPHVFTLDLMKPTKLSRFILWSRIHNKNEDGHYFRKGNAEIYSIYGAMELPDDTSLENWTHIARYHIKPPSGNPPGGTVTADDKEFVNSGFESLIPIEAQKFRYVRISIEKTFGNTSYSYTGDLKFYGQED